MISAAVMSGQRQPLPPVHTAALLHWPAAARPQADDILFIYPGIIHGEELHVKVDALLEEHALAYSQDGEASELVTEIILYWHYDDGTWAYDTYISRKHLSGIAYFLGGDCPYGASEQGALAVGEDEEAR